MIAAHLLRSKRGRQIIAVLLKYNFWLLVEPNRNIPLFRQWRNWRLRKLSIAKRIRLVLEELGPVFVKFGQILSTRYDLIPAEYVHELAKLQDGVPFEKSFDVREMIEAELNAPLETLFKEFDEVPIAAASLSQVYIARLHSGEYVAVKVQRPGIREQIECDIAFLEAFSRILADRLDNGWMYDPERMVHEFKKAVRLELDFENEGHNFEKFKGYFQDQEDVKVPRVYWKLTTSKVLTMEFIRGVKITDIVRPEYKRFYDISKVARREAEVILQQILEFGFFHADPHPANIFVLPPATLVLLDVGMVGYVDRNTSLYSMELMKAVAERDPRKVIKSWEGFGIIDQDRNINYRDVEQDLNELFLKYIDTGGVGGRVEVSLFGEEMIQLMVRNNLKIPANLSLMTKAFSTVEATGKMLDHRFNIFEIAQPHVERLMREKFSFSRTAGRVRDVFYDGLDLLEEMPKEVRSIIQKLRKGELRFNINHEGLEGVIDEMRASNSRVSLVLLIAAIAISSSMISERESGFIALSPAVLGIFGYAVAVILGITVIFSFFVSKRK